MSRIIFNAFVMNTPAHLSTGMWRFPGDTSHRHNSLSHWTELAALLERGRFDAMFMADTYGLSDVYGGSADAALRGAVQVPLHDPLLLVSAMANATRNLCFGVTCSTSYEAPFALARRFSTLDHLTQGRIGWNVVTSASDSTARNFGLERQRDHRAATTVPRSVSRSVTSCGKEAGTTTHSCGMWNAGCMSNLRECIASTTGAFIFQSMARIWWNRLRSERHCSTRRVRQRVAGHLPRDMPSASSSERPRSGH
jgi:hypothetical protein